MDSVIDFRNTYPLDSDLSGGYRYPTFEQPGPERQLTTARANQKTGLTNDRAANWAPEVEFSPFRTLSRRQMTFQFCY